MKKYRCPCCGDEHLKFFERNMSLGARGGIVGTNTPKLCESSGKKYNQYQTNKAACILKNIIWISVGIFLFALYLNHGKIIMLLLFLWVLFYAIADAITNTVFATVLEYNEDGERIIPTPDKDISIILDKPSRKIKYLSIYGVRFKKKTNNVRFHETFKNDLVPVVFLNKEKITDLPIHIIKAQFVPEMLLADGTELEIIDNGKVIGTGVFSNKREQT